MFAHRSVLLDEVLRGLRVTGQGGRYADGTLGGGGHAAAILRESGPGGWLFGCDRDGVAVAAARERLAEYAGRFQLRQSNFDGWADWIEPGSCRGVILDLGVSSPQLDQAERGFSFQVDGPLDMRMDPRQPRTAADWVNSTAVEDLERIFREVGEEPEARRLARAIGRERDTAPFQSTRQLAAFIERLCPRGGARKHPATRIFLALRVVVNDELGSLRRGLAGARDLLEPGGRLGVITFHSVEDRVVKIFGNEESRGYRIRGEVDVPELREPEEPRLRWVQRKAIIAGAEEIRANPRARSAQLRMLERL